MAISLVNNLYPPILPDAKAAFIRTNACQIFFSLSVYNSLSDIKNVQITLVNQKNNKSALKSNLYPSGIKIGQIYYNSEQQGDYQYYTIIETSDLQNGVFGVNEFYKVQLRLTSKQAEDAPSSGLGLATWLYDNKDFFSEWSTICLIKGIDQPHITIKGLTENGQTTLSTSPVDIVGQLYYDNGSEETQVLNSYNIQIFHGGEQSEPVYQTGTIYTDNYAKNQINCKLKYNFVKNRNYILTIQYETNNLYSNQASFSFNITETIINPMNASIAATADQENGRIKISISSNQGSSFTGTFVIRRSSSKQDFTIWEDIKKETYNSATALNYTWYDMTIEGGVWYKYQAQRIDANNNRGTPIQTLDPIMCVFEDMYLTKRNIQLKIQFNPTLGEYKYNITESQQVTLGSQFPFIKRNGSNFYRTFSIGGLITAFSDLTNWYDPHFVQGHFETNKNESKIFASRNELYGESKSLYDTYNDNKGINDHKDFLYEKVFRQKVINFLYKDDIKLFRSTTEGNILVRLMNVSFQPVDAVGRTLYSFTASAVEIDKAEYSNYIKYDIVQEV